MSEVSLAIGGRTYKVACAEGEEAHVTRLGQAIDAKLQSMPQLSAQDAQNLLFGALLLADELHDLRNAQTAAAAEAEEAKAEAERLRAEAESARNKADKLAAQVIEAEDHQQAIERLRSELDELRQAEADMGHELQAAQTAEAELREQLAALANEREELRRQVEAAQNTPGAELIGDPDLAPALERFAELLETCADKLEGRAASA